MANAPSSPEPESSLDFTPQQTTIVKRLFEGVEQELPLVMHMVSYALEKHTGCVNMNYPDLTKEEAADILEEASHVIALDMAGYLHESPDADVAYDAYADALYTDFHNYVLRTLATLRPHMQFPDDGVERNELWWNEVFAAIQKDIDITLRRIPLYMKRITTGAFTASDVRHKSLQQHRLDIGPADVQKAIRDILPELREDEDDGGGKEFSL